jgi:hypothetical protein
LFVGESVGLEKSGGNTTSIVVEFQGDGEQSTERAALDSHVLSIEGKVAFGSLVFKRGYHAYKVHLEYLESALATHRQSVPP